MFTRDRVRRSGSHANVQPFMRKVLDRQVLAVRLSRPSTQTPHLCLQACSHLHQHFPPCLLLCCFAGTHWSCRAQSLPRQHLPTPSPPPAQVQASGLAMLVHHRPHVIHEASVLFHKALSECPPALLSWSEQANELVCAAPWLLLQQPHRVSCFEQANELARAAPWLLLQQLHCARRRTHSAMRASRAVRCPAGCLCYPA